MTDMRTIYVTKYWQAQGIFGLRAEIVQYEDGPTLH